MTFSEMVYTRPDLEEIKNLAAVTLSKIESASNVQEQICAYREFDEKNNEVSTACNLAYIRHTIDTIDPFYDAENSYIDQITPLLQDMVQQIHFALLQSRFRPELEAQLGRLLFTNLEISVRTMKSDILELMQEENQLQSAYQKLCASAAVEWNGERIPLPKLGTFKQSPDRTIRRAAYEAEGRWFDDHQEDLDLLYDRLVKNRTAQGRTMRYKNFIPLGYDRLGRNCWGQDQAASFRRQIAEDLVPVIARIKKNQERRLGVDKLKFYDDTLLFPDGNAAPQGTAEDILAAGRETYHELSAETADFVDFLYEMELLDVHSREGKAPGGYCTDLAVYKAPFIFSNFNGTSSDVNVLTHEAGHAFAIYRAARKPYPSILKNPTLEACETHSITMEFLTAPWHHRFFGPLTGKHEIGHCEDGLSFLSYCCMVDEFQHLIYGSPDMTPAQRNETWLTLEGKYRPWTDFDNLPFYSRGAGWQSKLHIYQMPFYYIDYGMAQTVAFQLWLASMDDRDDAWARYLRFVDAAGTNTFADLVETAGMKLPYAPDCIKEVGQAVSAWLDKNPL